VRAAVAVEAQALVREPMVRLAVMVAVEQEAIPPTLLVITQQLIQVVVVVGQVQMGQHTDMAVMVGQA
tara:strand:+ start:444 stop:647 length:204 start_codon:yes stop_codon:yes gene_type:complete